MSLPVFVDSVYLNSNVFYAQLSISLLDLIYFSPFLILLGKQVYLKSNNTTRNGLVLLCVVLCRVALGAFPRLFDVSLSRLSLPFCVPSRFIAGFP